MDPSTFRENQELQRLRQKESLSVDIYQSVGRYHNAYGQVLGQEPHFEKWTAIALS